MPNVTIRLIVDDDTSKKSLFKNNQTKQIIVPYDSELYFQDCMYKIKSINLDINDTNNTVIFKREGFPEGEIRLQNGLYSMNQVQSQISSFYKNISTNIEIIENIINVKEDEDYFIDVNFGSLTIAQAFGFDDQKTKKLHIKKLDKKKTCFSEKKMVDRFIVMVHVNNISIKAYDPFLHESVSIIDSFVHVEELNMIRLGWSFYKNSNFNFTSIRNNNNTIALNKISCSFSTIDLHPIELYLGSVLTIGFKTNIASGNHN